MLTTDDGNLHYSSNVYKNLDLARKLNFYLQNIRDFEQEKQLLFEVDASYLKQLRHFKNLCTKLEIT